ncbi:hypothetical protein JTE90_022861 [Oedothorax gibbosus]|uniref:CID domain-containing protein n=1 Tax=Oedothorax gibbosus TaxID=931172 RepID=A0AAV6TWA7_9ARAC|nr:hypothetical protein JTE90_022861 [Oedothorax gibbosus]
MSEALAEEYRSSLLDLSYNSKPHINMLTILAEDNVKFAPTIVDTIITHIKSVSPDLKLPGLYLVDSIMKNVGGQYITLFSKHMITIFSSVFEKVEETTRSALYKLRQTWNDILPKNILYGIDVKVNSIDPAWPITAVVAAPPVVMPVSNTVVSPLANKNPIHVNPKFLGGPGTSSQNPDVAKSQEKLAVVNKIEATFKDKDTEMFAMRKKQDEMLKLIEEKKNQLKALEQKKLEMAAKQKNPTVLSTPAPVPAVPQKKFVSHRDPRLKKSMALAHSGGQEKPSATPLQSVVVVPNTKLPTDAINGSISSATPKTKDMNLNAPVAPFHQQSNKSFKGSPKGKNTSNRLGFEYKIPLNKNLKNGKKHSTSPENKLGANAKRHCNKQNLGKPKRTHSQESDSQHAKSQPTKKHKNEPLKSINKGNSETHHSEERAFESNRINPNLLGVEDKDYRHQLRSDEGLQSKETQNAHTTNVRASQEDFNSKKLNSAGMPISLPERNPEKSILPESIELKEVVPKCFVETYRPDIDQNIKQEHTVIEMKCHAIKNEIPDRSYTSVPVVPKTRVLPPATSSIMLDGKTRIIYFVNYRALTIMDNNEPREVTFAGPPRNVHIEGMPHPLLLGFDGRQAEFLTEGKINRVRFGAPSREIYINNFPYEAKFGGPHFTALLEDQKEHKIRIDGPPPQVMISEKPAYDLYEQYINKSVKKESEDLPSAQDVDMRLKPSQMLPECKKDIDWRHVASLPESGPQGSWKNSQNSFETYRDLPGTRNYAPVGTSVTLPMEYMNSSIPMTVKSEHFYPDRNSSMNQPPWPHPGYREGEMNPLNQTMHMQQKPQHIPPNMPWAMKTATTLAPPPSIPLSLNLPTQSSNFNMGGPQMAGMEPRPAFWDPLPPPPMFPGQGIESQTRVPILPNPIPEPVIEQPSIPSLPINVNAIYEKLIAAGILPKKTEEPKSLETEAPSKDSKTTEEVKEEEEIKVPHIRLTPKCLREYNPAGISLLYRGSQCATCGMRFKEIQSEQYSRHLDWHFRMNRREKDGAKKAYSRRMYYEITDWIQFKEIEEAEERMPSYFELQTDDASKNEEQEKVQSVPASACESEKCSVCSDKFQLFWVEDEEEWHLKNAVIHDGEAYHPMCYEDHKKAVELAKKEAEKTEEIVPEPIKEEPQEAMPADQENLIKEEEIKKEKEEESLSEEAPTTATEVKKEPESVEDQPVVEDTTTITEEAKEPTEETAQEMEVDKSESAAETEEVPKEVEPAEVSVPAEVKPNPEGDSVCSPEEVFRPPTPDPRFEVLPPVFKGTELSALCTIM